MNKTVDVSNRPAWMTGPDELPHQPQDVPLWSESYMSYVYSPGNQVGIWVHLGYKPGKPGLWEETIVIGLPADRYLVARGFSSRPMDDGISICGVSWRCDEPYLQWTKRFRGGAQLVSREEMSAGPLRDGLYMPVDLEYTCHAICSPNDYGEEHMKVSWASRHYEQSHEASGYLSFAGERYEINGSGWRDHSWGPRDLTKFGSHTWLSAQFPQSGRSIMAVLLLAPGRPHPFSHALLCRAATQHQASVSGLPIARDISETETDFEFSFNAEENTSVIRATILQPLRVAYVGTNQIGIGTHRGPDAHHDWVSSFTRFEWDGEIGYGSSERSVDLAAGGAKHG